MTDRKALREVVLVYLAITAATVLVTRLRAVPAANDYVHLLVGALFLVTAVKLAEREPGGLRRYGIDLAGVLAPPEPDAPADTTDAATDAPRPRRRSALLELFDALRDALPSALRETAVALGVVAVVFPPFALGFHFWHGPSHPFVLRAPPDLASFALAQLVVVALPEEALFRGYVQTRLADAFPTTVRLLGVRVSPVALLGQAALFGLMHFAVDLAPERLAVAFPALLFGLVRTWRGGIGAALLVHALSNLYADILVRGWL
jgi:membrane protease YdiL (CAAX protease family)